MIACIGSEAKRTLSVSLTLLILSMSSLCLAQIAGAPSSQLQAEPQGGYPTQPKYLRYDPTQPIPSGYTLSSRYRRGYVIAGSITFGVGYGLGAIVALSDTETDFNRRWLLLPVFGPFIGMATQRKTCESYTRSECNYNGGTIRALAILGAMQIIGASLFTYGEVQREPVLVRQNGLNVRLAPAAIGQAGYGFAALGTF